MANRNALGRGLSALIEPPKEFPPPTDEESPPTLSTESGPLFVSVDRISPSPGQPRKTFRDKELAELAESIREHGILQPLVVRRRGDGYELIIGERRWRAAKLAKLGEVPCAVLDATDRQVVEMALVENVQRADLNPIEIAEAFRTLVHEEGMSQEEAGNRVGLDRSSVGNHLRLLDLGTDLQQDLIDGRLSMGHAKAILQAPEEARRKLRDRIVRERLTVRAAEDLSRRAAAGGGANRSTTRPGPRRDPHITDLEDRIGRQLQTKVRIVGRPGRGRVELHYFGPDELDRLSDRLLDGA
ncbi:MAG: ParB/RepB/Spo0J family partition protein [Proteobacteria bacterium]|nr:ParB/RepB/Spo0J family partition protein [Pseudomonadota bacterium]